MDFICYSWPSNCDIVKWWQLIFHWWKEEWQINLTHIYDYVSHILYKHYHVLWLSLFFSKVLWLALLNQTKYVFVWFFFPSICLNIDEIYTRNIVWLDSIRRYHWKEIHHHNQHSEDKTTSQLNIHWFFFFPSSSINPYLLPIIITIIFVPLPPIQIIMMV